MLSRANAVPPDGILLVDKAEGWTSHDVVARSRRALGTRKVGHAGTLDPMATGLLVLGAGPSTRLLTHLVGLDKTYTATVRLGHSTVTDDREGERVEEAPAGAIEALAADPDRIMEAAVRLTGAIEQVPSAVSAIKIGGKRAYDLVRSGEHVELKRRAVTVSQFDLAEPRPTRTDDGLPVIDVDAVVTCSSGTYVRALARDLGDALGVFGHLTALRRTRVGPFDVESAVPLDALAEPSVTPPLRSPASVATLLFPELALTEAQAADLANGKRLDLTGTGVVDTATAAATAPDGRLVGLVEIACSKTRVITNFPVPQSPPQQRGAPA